MGMTQERIKECIKLLETDGINSKAMVLEILKKELASMLLVQETKIEKDVMFNCCFLVADEFTRKMRRQCLYRIGKRIVKDSLLGLKFKVTPLSIDSQLPPDIKGIKVQARFRYVIEDILKERAKEIEIKDEELALEQEYYNDIKGLEEDDLC